MNKRRRTSLVDGVFVFVVTNIFEDSWIFPRLKCLPSQAFGLGTASLFCVLAK
jgi:hypothetical protein